MKRAVFLLVAAATSTFAAIDPQQLADAARPLEEGVPEVAVLQLQHLQPLASSDEERSAIALKLGEALNASARPNEALNVLSQPAVEQTADAKFQRGQALAQLGRFAEAHSVFHEIGTAAAQFGEAEMLRAMREPAEALRAYGRLTHDEVFGARAQLRALELAIETRDLRVAHRLLEEAEPKQLNDRRERRVLRGRLELAEGRADRAVSILESLARMPGELPHDVAIAALLTMADANIARRTPESGDDFLEAYIEHHPADAALPKLFAKLDQLYTMERKPARGELERWTRDPAQPRRAFAQWYVARLELRGGRRERATRDFDELTRTEARSPDLVPGFIHFARLMVDSGEVARAVDILAAARAMQPSGEIAAQLDVAEGRVAAATAKPRDAAAAFDRALPFAPAALNDVARFNATLAWMQVGDSAETVARVDHLEVAERADFEIEQALTAAARNDAAADATLARFISNHAQHPRVAEALVARAELAFHSNPPRMRDAREFLSQSRRAGAAGAATERADYLEVWLDEVDDAKGDRMIGTATNFLREHANSAFAADVRMKLGEAYFRREDFANAQTQFERIAQLTPPAALADKALFFAAQCAVSRFEPGGAEHALSLLAKVVRSDSDLKWAARNQQAAIERRLGKTDDAMALYEEVLHADARPSDKREALCAKGDLLLERGATDHTAWKRAAECYAQLAADKGAAAHWRNQALYKQALCTEKGGDREGALAAYYRVVDAETRERPGELFWYYKAGFDAARLLEEGQRWQSAANLYDRLASSGGARSDEAKAQLERLRLEHFLWSE